MVPKSAPGASRVIFDQPKLFQGRRGGECCKGDGGGKEGEKEGVKSIQR